MQVVVSPSQDLDWGLEVEAGNWGKRQETG